MEANPAKFQAMAANDSHLDFEIDIDGNIIKGEPQVTLLGVSLDIKLNFSTHIANLCRKGAEQLNVLCRISNFLDISAKLAIYTAFILSNFNYCPVVWHQCRKQDKAKLERLQKELCVLFSRILLHLMMNY